MQVFGGVVHTLHVITLQSEDQGNERQIQINYSNILQWDTDAKMWEVKIYGQ